MFDAPVRQDIHCFSVFYMRCVRSILGVSSQRWWSEHISNAQLFQWLIDSETIASKLRHRHLEWLGHVARLEDIRLLKQILFGTQLSRRPAHGPRRRWKDCTVKDLRTRGLEADWFKVACDSRSDWRLAYAADISATPMPVPAVGGECALSSSNTTVI